MSEGKEENEGTDGVKARERDTTAYSALFSTFNSSTVEFRRQFNITQPETLKGAVIDI